MSFESDSEVGLWLPALNDRLAQLYQLTEKSEQNQR